MELGRKAAATFEESLGPSHVYVAFARMNTANALAEMGRFEAAWEEARQAESISRSKFPAGHPLSAMMASTSGEILRRWGRPSEALQRQEAAAQDMEKHHGARHGDVATVLFDLGRTYQDLGRFGEARTTLARALDIRLAMLPEDHPGIAAVRDRLAALPPAVARPSG